MSLFQNSVLNKYLKGLEAEKVNESYERFTSHFHNPTIQENIRNSKEEQYQGEFLIDLFVNVLDYTKNPTPDFNLTTELKNIKGSKKTDGAILKGEKALAVIELKGTNTTDLSKVETQAFGYKNNQPGCNYVITSNFEKLRFYIDNAVDFEEFNLFQLTKERFEILCLCLSSEYLLKDIPKKIKDESLTQEENITKKLYKDYASFRNEIFDAIQNENPEYDKLTLFKKTQKLLDRFLFIFFAEDRLLLPPNSIRSIVNQWTDLKDKYDEYFPLYDRFKKYFGYMNTGHKGHQHDIFAYNGGLFAPDEILDNIKINDDLLYKHTVNLSNYDFESEVSVNILGHIFEHSLNDIDEIQAEIQGISSDQSKTKRKKDGVFYTPKYITKYIVDNTVGKLCEEKKTELDIQEAEYEKERKGRQKATLKKLTQKLDDYRKWLLQITICDPACGSGAFLNQALEFLITEHKYIDELQAKLFGDAMVLSEVENAILENNIYGVDINDESVEIAKLSLWLRTAQKGRKLTSLNNNIKCGNSLIDDKEIAGEKAFNWKEEFPEVFANGGFDLIIGNPPYVNFKMYPSSDREFYKVKFIEIFNGKADLLYYFFYLSLDILKENGALGFITSRYWLEAEYATLLRNVMLKTTEIKKILDFKNITIFEDAGVKSNITILRNKTANIANATSYYDFYGKKIVDINTATEVDKFEVMQSSLLLDEDWKFFPKLTLDLISKIKNSGVALATICHCLQDVITGADKIFVIRENDDFWGKIEDEYLKDWIKVGDIHRYSIKPVEKRKVVYTELIDVEEIPNSVDNYLQLHQEKLNKRSGVKNGSYSWIGWHRYRNREYINQPKLITRFKASHNTFAIDLNNSYSSADVTHVILKEENIETLSLEYLCGLLNSKLLDFYFKSYGKLMDYRYEYYPSPVGKISLLVAGTNEQKIVYDKVIYISNIIEKLKNLELKINQFIQSKHSLEKQIISDLDKMSFNDLIKELKKQKVELNISEQAEWMQYFNDQKELAQSLKGEIEKTDAEIDVIVYSLYGLTGDEIKIVEEATA